MFPHWDSVLKDPQHQVLASQSQCIVLSSVILVRYDPVYHTKALETMALGCATIGFNAGYALRNNSSLVMWLAI